MKTFFTILFSGIALLSCTQNTPTGAGIFSYGADIGNPQKKGSATYNEADQVYTIKGGGYNIWFERDEFYFLYNKIKGDFTLTANFEFVGEAQNIHRKFGWIARESLDDKSIHITAAVHFDTGLTILQWRPEYGAVMRDPEDELFADSSHYNIIQLERLGNIFTMRVAHTGHPFEVVGSHELSMPEEALVGLFVCAHEPDALEEAKIWNVKIE